ncbi:hypothetical protein [Microcoleus sp. N9_A1]|uniref:hypothetical protein n=1 Tax=Microcoleus sp. N9_A1 TaxID=3055380 RepID=UPI002FD45245
MVEINPFPEKILDQAREQAASTTQKEKDIKAQAEEVERLCKLWDNLNRFLHKQWPLHCLDLLDKHKHLIEKMRVDQSSEVSLMDDIYRVAKERAEELKPHRFPAYLEKACQATSLQLDQDSRHPRYKFEKGFFQLDIDDHKKIASLSNYESSKMVEFPADIGAIVEVVQREHKRIFERTFDGKKFIKKLLSQYLAILKKDKLSDGSTIPIRNITQRLGKNESGFRTDEFLIDLSRLVEQGPIEIDGCRLELQQTKETNQGMLLHIEQKRYIGFMFFKKV